ncbi:glycosyltransferase family 39 protein [Candidatus Dojkabacteria bacterium]|uniref:Glycosyltransferase family 39 protein n=1 Tax=Candidatus Dojkabacteria bacterium TaxID=2099670 RepID=A0A955L4S7_9BACT|nr:glycosyltransferase family 39 protein [Candidatus Dojkabacteria bacterium]
MNRELALLMLIILIGSFVRFYNLAWDEGWFFHPDERNIASAVLNLDPEVGDYNPDFFAYGTLPIYLTRVFSGNDFPQAILVGRTMSAFFSTLLIPLTYLITKKALIIIDKKKKNQSGLALFAAVLVAFAPGMIQFAHFATYEIFLTFEYMLAIFFAFRVAEKGRLRDYIFLGLALAFANATKVVSLSLVPILFVAHFIYVLTTYYKTRSDIKKSLVKLLLNYRFYLALLICAVFSIALFPYLVLDYEAFQGSMNYEGPVARGELLVFYTQQFKETIPFVYQVVKVFPYILGWPVTILGLFSAIYFLLRGIKDVALTLVFRNKKKNINYAALILSTAAILYGGFHFTLYVKWTRYMIPLVPMFIILSVLMLKDLYKIRKIRAVIMPTLVVITIIMVVQGLNFFTIYTKPDPRVAAADWASQNIVTDAQILAEIYDLGITPWNGKFPVQNITLYNFYDLDTPGTTLTLEELREILADTDYIVVTSNRIYPTKLRLIEQNPIAGQFYAQLFDGTLGYKQIAEFDRDTVLEDLFSGDEFNGIELPATFQYDESFKVFDQPTILVFAKVN